MYQLTYSKQAINALRKMPRNWSNKILAKLKVLSQDPYSSRQVKPLKGIDGYRLRVGDWRIIYTVADDELLISVIKVAPRGGVYQ